MAATTTTVLQILAYSEYLRKFDAKGVTIGNAGDPEDETDLVTLGWLEKELKTWFDKSKVYVDNKTGNLSLDAILAKAYNDRFVNIELDISRLQDKQIQQNRQIQQDSPARVEIFDDSLKAKIINTEYELTQLTDEFESQDKTIDYLDSSFSVMRATLQKLQQTMYNQLIREAEYTGSEIEDLLKGFPFAANIFIDAFDFVKKIPKELENPNLTIDRYDEIYDRLRQIRYFFRQQVSEILEELKDDKTLNVPDNIVLPIADFEKDIERINKRIDALPVYDSFISVVDIDLDVPYIKTPTGDSSLQETEFHPFLDKIKDRGQFNRVMVRKILVSFDCEDIQHFLQPFIFTLQHQDTIKRFSIPTSESRSRDVEMIIKPANFQIKLETSLLSSIMPAALLPINKISKVSFCFILQVMF